MVCQSAELSVLYGMKYRMVHILSLFLFSAPAVISAQQPFQTFDAGLSGDLITGGNSILDHWDYTPGVTLELRSPYYRGEFEAATRFVRFRDGSFENSSFRSYYVYLGWFYPIRISERFSAAPGIRIGNHFLIQDHIKKYFLGEEDTNPYTFQRDESEFAYEIALRTEYRLSDAYKLHFSASYNRTLINIPFSVIYTSIGITRTINTPGWLKRIVR